MSFMLGVPLAFLLAFYFSVRDSRVAQAREQRRLEIDQAFHELHLSVEIPECPGCPVCQAEAAVRGGTRPPGRRRLEL